MNCAAVYCVQSSAQAANLDQICAVINWRSVINLLSASLSAGENENNSQRTLIWYQGTLISICHPASIKQNKLLVQLRDWTKQQISSGKTEENCCFWDQSLGLINQLLLTYNTYFFCNTVFYACFVIVKGIVLPKMTILSLITHRHVVSNP